MWSHIVICLLVGFAFASTNPGWKDNSEYVYRVRGRTLVGLHEVAKQYSGIMYKCELRIQPKSDGSLKGQISNPQYSQVHSHLHDGWNSDIPDSDVNYKPMSLSNKPFKIEMRDGVIEDLIVSKDIPNYEANIIKSIVSQFQLNTNGVDHLRSKLTALHEDDDNSAVFKTMEDTVTGRTETTYDIHPLPEYVLQSKPWLARHLHLKGDGEVIEVVKHKNYSNNEELPLYHYGFGDMKNYDPATNQMGHFFIRDSISRAILTGNLKRYTVQQSYTVNEIIMSPTLNNKQKGQVVSAVNVTLEEIKSQDDELHEVSNPIPLGNLVYTYANPKTGSVIKKQPNESSESSEERYQRSATMQRIRRAIGNNHDSSTSESSSSSSSSEESHEYYQRSQPKLREAPQTPLLPYSTAYKGMPIKKSIDIQKTVHKMAQDIGKDLQDPEQFLQQSTLSKFTTLTELIRSMDSQELKQVASELYSQEQNGPQRATWTAFRDAVAECGSGPAFLTIQEWIQSDKIKDEEAAEIIMTMANSVREPTRDYLKSYFDFIKSPKVKSQEYLHQSALLSFSNLVRQVCVDTKEAKRQYPVKSFGRFCSEEQLKQVEESVIPYFTQQLNDAVSKAETQKIHAYIRALGNVGHQKILAAFEPYLEGEKQASQFQRFLMVISMDKLAEADPKVARSVLYKIYQNSGEAQEVRVAAVYQLMRTSPPTDMLQRMASYTNIDTDEQVNAAVKSAIESASELHSEEHQWLRSSAEAARPLLTKKSYGVQHGQTHLRTYVMQELKMKYKSSLQYFGSEETYWPRGLISSMRNDLGGMKNRLFTVQAVASSVDELFRVAQYQTKDYQDKMKQQNQNAEEQKQNKFSSLNIARLLNMKSDEREQLEGYLYNELHGAFNNFWSFDNHSMENLAEEIRKIENRIKNGEQYNHAKMTNCKKMMLSFPTEIGFPFLFTYDTPRLIKVEGNVQGEASPQLSSGKHIQHPDKFNLKTSIGLTVNMKTEGRLSFTTPFDGQQYISGFDKNLQVHIPLHATVKFDLKNSQFEAEIQNKEIHNGAHLFHYSTWPFTSRADTKNFEPISRQQNTHYIQQDNMRTYDEIVGKDEPGVAVRVHIEHKREFINIPWLSQLVQKYGVLPSLWKLWDDASIQYGQINIQLQPDQSPAKKIAIKSGYESKYWTEKKSGKGEKPNWNQLASSSSKARRDSLIDSIGSGINSASVYAMDASVEFQGGKNNKYSVMGGVGRSNVDPQSHVLAHYKKDSDEDYEVELEARSHIPNTNGLDLSDSFKTEPKADITVNVKFGENLQSAAKAQLKFELRRSNERKQYLTERPMYKQCQREMKQGNYQLPACANMTMAANLLDRVKVHVKHENIHDETQDRFKMAYEMLKMYYYPSLEVDEDKGTGQSNEVECQARFDPDLRSVNISVKAKDHQSTINTIQVEEWTRNVFVVHPVFHLRSRISAPYFGLHTYRPICVVDKTHASTFNNRTYPVPLSDKWALLMHYVPKQARDSDQQKPVEEQLKYQPENYAVLARQHSGSDQQKEVKITVSSPETNYKVIEVTMTPASGSDKAKVTVNGQEVQVSEHKSHDLEDGYIQIYSLPNGEVKVEVSRAFYAIYDGERVKLTAVSGKFRDSTRGLCGAFNDDETNDFLTSENCIACDNKQFIKSFEVEGSEGQQQRRQFAGRTSQCVEKDVPLYANVISDQDAGRRGSSSGRTGKGTKFQTQYMENGSEMCFTIHPVPVCHSKHQERGTVRKHVPVHCVQNTNIAQLWKAQIDKGASPDFSHKKETRTMEIQLPKSCAP